MVCIYRLPKLNYLDNKERTIYWISSLKCEHSLQLSHKKNQQLSLQQLSLFEKTKQLKIIFSRRTLEYHSFSVHVLSVNDIVSFLCTSWCASFAVETGWYCSIQYFNKIRHCACLNDEVLPLRPVTVSKHLFFFNMIQSKTLFSIYFFLE